MSLSINPITKKRLQRFKEMKRAYYSLCILAFLYLISLSSELICNNTPLYIRFKDKSYFPIFKFYPEDEFNGSGNKTRPDYKELNKSPLFENNHKNFMIFPPFNNGPFESAKVDDIPVSDKVEMIISKEPQIGTVNISKNSSIVRSHLFDYFIKSENIHKKEIKLNDHWQIPEELQKAINIRFENKKADPFFCESIGKDNKKAIISLSSFKPRKRPPKTVRLTFREKTDHKPQSIKIIFNKNNNNELKLKEGLENFNCFEEQKDILLQKVQERFDLSVEPYFFNCEKSQYKVNLIKEDVRFPFHPVKGYILGIDSAGRDVLARILYGLRTSMTFGLILVICSMFIGIIFGAFQGYYGGIVDMAGQRFTEIWSALPFLYIMILMGSIYGRSFLLLLFCYGLFNWIGISYYMRAEFLRLRKESFVEAAQCLGLSTKKIIFRHILPNALVPVITFFPFSLVGAIGSLAALDYLGFGMPPPTASWGELLSQAQTFRWAWWLILYPFLALFIVMLLGVFVGEGVRNAYDPKRYSAYE